jgi:L-ascorbate metabolism protein UlaG (beta-lactamase superfamily)
VHVKWLGHSCFLLTSEAGIKIMTDPYAPAGGLKYGPIGESADVVTVSHDHGDHSNVAGVKGHPEIFRGPGNGQFKGISFKGMPAFHDEANGTKRGKDTIFVFEVDGLRFCHLGDLGHELTDAEVKEIGDVDVLFLPVGGFYTFEPDIASRVAAKIKPKVTIPMHFKTSKVDTAAFGAIVGPELFLKGKTSVDRRKSSEIELKVGALPKASIVVLEPAL